MKVAIIGSRSLNISIEKYLPEDITLIISGGARGIDRQAEKYADKKGIPKLIILPDYHTIRAQGCSARAKQIDS